MKRGFDREALKTQLRLIRSAHPENLMARHFTDDYLDSLDQNALSRVWNIIKTGYENPDSHMGAYAQSSSDYEDFQTLLEPMIRDHHDITPGQQIAQQHDWGRIYSKCNLEDIDSALSDVSMRVRVGRNLAAIPLPGAMSEKDRVKFENDMIKAFTILMKDPEFCGTYLSLTPGSEHAINAVEYQSRVDNHQMFKDMRMDPYLVSGGIASDWPYGRGMYISGSGDFIVWVGEEDHLRIMSMHKGGDLSGLYARLRDGLDKLTTLLPAFAHSPRYGYLTSCPSNLGTAMRASLHLPLPATLAGLAQQDSRLKELGKSAAKFGLALRGAGGEHSGTGRDSIIDISPSARLGVTESEIMQRLFDGTAALWAQLKDMGKAPRRNK